MFRFFYCIILGGVLLLQSVNAVAQPSSVLVRGKVVERQGNRTIEFATIMLGDPVTKVPITGTTTDIEGRFELKAATNLFYVEVSFLGYKNRVIEDFEVDNGTVDLGTIVLFEDSQSLNEVEVRAEKSMIEFKLDKRVFNVGKDLSTTGASALEVLNNVPSVNVNVEGEISLRGSIGVESLQCWQVKRAMRWVLLQPK